MDVITKTFPAYTLTTWNLSELLLEPSEQVFTARLAELDAAVAAFERCRGELTPGMDPGAFLDILREYEALYCRMQVISGYASLWFYSDTGSQEALTFRNRVQQATTSASNRKLFFTLFSMLTNRLEFTLEVDGETRKLTRNELMSYAFSLQPELRAEAYRELY